MCHQEYRNYRNYFVQAVGIENRLYKTISTRGWHWEPPVEMAPLYIPRPDLRKFLSPKAQVNFKLRRRADEFHRQSPPPLRRRSTPPFLHTRPRAHQVSPPPSLLRPRPRPRQCGSCRRPPPTASPPLPPPTPTSSPPLLTTEGPPPSPAPTTRPQPAGTGSSGEVLCFFVIKDLG